MCKTLTINATSSWHKMALETVRNTFSFQAFSCMPSIKTDGRSFPTSPQDMGTRKPPSTPSTLTDHINGRTSSSSTATPLCWCTPGPVQAIWGAIGGSQCNVQNFTTYMQMHTCTPQLYSLFNTLFQFPLPVQKWIKPLLHPQHTPYLFQPFFPPLFPHSPPFHFRIFLSFLFQPHQPYLQSSIPDLHIRLDIGKLHGPD